MAVGEGADGSAERKRLRAAATEALLGAIERRSVSGLEAAIAAAVEAGHQGELAGGRLWCTSELKVRGERREERGESGG